MRRSVVWRTLVSLSAAIPLAIHAQAVSTPGQAATGNAALMQPPKQRAYPTHLPSTLVHPGSVLVAFRVPMHVERTHAIPDSGAATRDIAALSATLDGLHTAHVDHLFAGVPVASLNAARARAEAATGRYVTDFTQVYLVSFDPAINDGEAANRLAQSPLVASATPNFIFQVPQHVAAAAPAASAAARATARVSSARIAPRAVGLANGLPDSYGYATDAQSYHDAASNNITGAWSMLRTLFQADPGQGETITNISLGRIDDKSTVLEPGQRYLEYRGFPKIPTFVSNGRGTGPILDPTGTNAGDPGQAYDLTEPMLDFSIMAPPPIGDPRVPNQQAPGQLGNLLGAAYGASYRLIDPAQNGLPDTLAAFLGAGFQTPAPTILTASIGWGALPGFSANYLEEQALLIHDAVTLLVHGLDIFVTTSAGDGQTDTASAMNPNGIIGATDVTTDPSKQVDINCFFGDPNCSSGFTFEPQYLLDSGANDAAGDTLNDIFNNSPSNFFIDARARHSQHTTETRWTGQQNFNSGYGTRANISAPADDVLFLAQVDDNTGFPVDPVSDQPELIGGTSASCPEVAAAAAILRQASKLIGHPLSAVQTRALLAATGRPHSTPFFDLDHANVGPELDLTRAVSALFAFYGVHGTPSLVRMTVAQRKAIPYSTGYGRGFYTDTPQDPVAGTATVDLSQGLAASSNFAAEVIAPTGDNLNAPLTFAVDGAFLPLNATYHWSLSLGSGPSVAVPGVDAALPYIRLLPFEIFSLLKQPIITSTDRIVNVTVNTTGLTKTMAVTFKGQSDPTYTHAIAPAFNPVFRPNGNPAAGITVFYDLQNLRGATAGSTVDGGELIVSDIDRILPRAFPDSNRDAHGCKVPLHGLEGFVTIKPTDPAVAACLGRGVGAYGLALRGTVGGSEVMGSTSAWLPLRYAPALEQHPATPKVQAAVSAVGATAPVYLDVADTEPTGGSPYFTVSYDTSAVFGARGALIELSAPSANLVPPLFFGLGAPPDVNNFTNPYGDRLDSGDNLGMPGSVYHTFTTNTTGSIALNGAAIGLTIPAGGCDNAYQVRVFATDGSGRIIGVASNPSIIDYADLSQAACSTALAASAAPAAPHRHE